MVSQNGELYTNDDESDEQLINNNDDKEDGAQESDEENEVSNPRIPLNRDPEFLNPDESKFKYGIIYLSYIPEGITVKILREIMSQFGELGRMYLEPEKNNKKHRTYVEGWIEFKKKRIAKSVAKSLNGKALQYGRKNCKMNGQIWSIKYLHRFKWVHLTEQLAHDRAVKEQKRIFEMSQTKKQVDFYQKMTERSMLQKKIRSKRKNDDEVEPEKMKSFKDKQNRPVNNGQELFTSVSEDFLGSIFKKVA